MEHHSDAAASTGGGDPSGKAVRKFCPVQAVSDVGLNQGSAEEGETQRWIQGKKMGRA